MKSVIITLRQREDKNNRRKFTALKAISDKKLEVLAGAVVGDLSEKDIDALRPVVITRGYWVPVYVELTEYGTTTVRNLEQHDENRAWNIIFSLVHKYRNREEAKKTYLPLVRVEETPRMRKVRELNNKYRTTYLDQKAVLISRGSDIDMTLREIYNGGGGKNESTPNN